jgi:hypothetical protein
MKSLAAIVIALPVTVGAAQAGEIVIKPKSSDAAVVLTISGGKTVDASYRGGQCWRDCDQAESF